MRTMMAITMLIALLVPRVAQAQGIADRLPADTVFVFSAPNLQESLQQFKTTALWQIWQEPSIQALYLKLRGMGAEQMGEDPLEKARTEFKAATGVDLDDLPNVLTQGSLSLALVDFKVDGDMPEVDLVASLDLNEADKRFDALYAYVIDQIKANAAGTGAELSQVQVGDVEVLQIAPPGAPPSIQICIARQGTRLLVTTSLDGMKRQLSASIDGATLAKNADFITARKDHGVRGEAAFSYINVQAILARTQALIPPFAQQIMTELAVDSIKGLAASWSIEEGEFVDRYTLVMPHDRAQPRGLQTVLSYPTISLKAVKYAPRNAASFTSAGLDIAGVYREVMRVWKAIDEESFAEMQQQLGSAEEELGIKIEKLIGSLGSELSTWTAFEDGAATDITALFNAVYALELKDAAVFKEGLNKILQAIGAPEPEIENIGGIEIAHYALPQGNADMPFNSIGIAIHDGMLFVSLPGKSLSRMANDLASGAPTMAANEAFQQALVRYPRNLSAFSYTDLANYLTTAWRAGQPMIVQMLEGTPFSADDLPDVEKLVKHLKPLTQAITSDEQGSRAIYHSSVGSLALVAAVGAGAAIAVPSFSAAKAKANLTSDQNKLKQIGLAMVLYHEIHGKYPEELSDLIKGDQAVLNAEDRPFVSPLDEFPMKEPSGLETSYIYIYANVLGKDGADKIIVAYNRSPLEEGQRHILYLDGSVALVDDETFREQFAKQKEALKKHGINVFPTWGKSR